jgi:hypothetical protein
MPEVRSSGDLRRSERPRARRVEVTECPRLGDGFDYADAFETELPRPDERSPESWIRAGMEDSPAVVEWIACRLGLGNRPVTTSPEIASGRVIESTPQLVEIEWSLPLAKVVVIGRRSEPAVRSLSSFLYYERPVLARLVWSVVGVGHRRMVRGLMTRNF